MFHVNDVIWFLNPLQSLTQTDRHDGPALIPLPHSLYCCVSLSACLPYNLFILLTSQIFSCAMRWFHWLLVMFDMAQKQTSVDKCLVAKAEWGQNEADRLYADKKVAHDSSNNWTLSGDLHYWCLTQCETEKLVGRGFSTERRAGFEKLIENTCFCSRSGTFWPSKTETCHHQWKCLLLMLQK